jgi:MarR family transcriptional regulator for hemolysin
MPDAGSADPDEAAAIDLALLEGLVGFTIHILDLQIYQLFYERFAAGATTPGILATLLAIKMNPGARHGALADALMIQRPNMTKLINRLERDGLVRRDPSREDKRSVVLNLTRAGAAAVESGLEKMMAHEAASLAPLGASERRLLLSLLRRLSDGLRQRGSQSAAPI